MKKILLWALVSLIPLSVWCDEGMWMLNRIDQKTADAMQGLGLELTPSELYNPDGMSLKDAVVDFGDFCSGVLLQGIIPTQGSNLGLQHCRQIPYHLSGLGSLGLVEGQSPNMG